MRVIRKIFVLTIQTISIHSSCISQTYLTYIGPNFISLALICLIVFLIAKIIF